MQEHLENQAIAERLDSFATLLELAGANPYSSRAYRRAAELIRATEAPVADLIRAGRVRELRGIGRGIEGRLRELVETGEIAELEELEREVQPDLVGLGRYLGIGARQAVLIARTLGVRTAAELREAAAAGRLREVPGIGPQKEAKLLAALERVDEPRPPRGLLLHRARRLRRRDRRAARRHAGRRPAALQGLERAVRRGRVRGRRPGRGTRARSSRCPAIVSVARARGAARATASPSRGFRSSSSSRSRSGSAPSSCARPARPSTSPRSSRCPTRPTRRASTGSSEIPFCPPELREAPFRGKPPVLLEHGDDPRRPAQPHDLVRRNRERRDDGRSQRSHCGYEYLAICDHTPAVGAVRGLTADDLRRQALEIADANEALAPFRVLRGTECDILPDGRLDLPDSILAELDWVQASVHGGQRLPKKKQTEAGRCGRSGTRTCPACRTRRGDTSTAAPRTSWTSTG